MPLKMRDAEFGTGNGEREMADDKCRMADDKCRMADDKCRMADDKCRMADGVSRRTGPRTFPWKTLRATHVLPPRKRGWPFASRFASRGVGGLRQQDGPEHRPQLSS